MKILGKEYDKVLFVHIPKTAGSSISKILYDNNLDNWKRGWPRHHDPYFYLEQNNSINDSVFSFAVVRNPYRRTYSCFHQYNKTNKTNISFIEYLINIKNNNISKITPLLHLPQSFYIIDNKGFLQVNKLYKFENIKELEEDFNWQLELYNVGNYVVESYIEDYTNEAIELTKKLYASDFSTFGYNLDFSKSLGELWISA